VVKTSILQHSPLSPTRWPPEAFDWLRSLAVILVLIAATLAGAILDSLILPSLGVPLRSGQLPPLSWGLVVGQLLNYVPILAVALGLLPWLSGRSLRELGLRPLDRTALVAAAVGAVAMECATLLVALVQFVLTHDQPHQAAVTLLSGSKDVALRITFVAIAVGFAPFVEELVFRGILFNALLRYTPHWVAAVLSALAFAASHHDSWSALLPLTGAGIVLAYVYYVSGSLTASIITHALFNLFNVIAIELGHP
jgi:membrane protease YdiL (CAAX protease family)